jgi:putative cell wall-binding protein
MIASVLALIAVPASAGTTVTQKRYSGIDRYATSAMAATGAFATGTNAVVLVSGEGFADGLSAAGLAGVVGGPVLLTHPTTLLGSTANAIGALDTGTASAASKLTVHVIGGVNAVSAGVVTSLTGLGYTVARISGADRYSTAVAVGNKIRSLTTIGSVVSKTSAILVSGTGFADGLAAGGLAYQLKLPIVLTNGTALTAGTKAFLDSEVNPAARVIIVGGTAAVSAAVATEVVGIKNGLVAIDVDRVSGADRYATALEFAKYRTKSAVLQGNAETATNLMLVSGENFADALSSAAKAGVAATMTLLVGPTGLDSASDSWIASKFTTINNVFVTGGTSAVSTAAATAAKTSATTVKVTSTMTASKNATCVKVVYNAIMAHATAAPGAHGTGGATDGTGASDSDNYKLNNTELVIDAATPLSNKDNVCGGFTHDAIPAAKIGAISCVDSATAGTTSCYIKFGTAMAVGDVLTIGSTAVPASAVGSRAAVSSAHTVAADVTKATITWDPLIVGSTTGTFSVSELVQVVDTANTTNLTHDDIVCTEGTASALTATNQKANTYMFTVAAFTASDTCTIAASAFMDTSGLAAPALTSTSGISVSDTVGATLSAARTKTVTTGAVTAELALNSGANTGGFKLAAKTTGAYAGPAGNSWKIEVIGATAGGTGTVTLYDVVSKKIVVTVCIASCGAGVSPTAQTVVNVLNAHSSISANFTATVFHAGAVNQVVATTSLAGGSQVYDIVISSNEIMAETTDADAWDDASFTMDTDGAGTGTAGCAITQDAADLVATPNATDWYLKKLNVTCTASTTAQMISAGVSQIVSGSATEDFKGNVVAAAARRFVITG